MLQPSLDPDESTAARDVVENILLCEPDERRNITCDFLGRVGVIDVVRVDEEGFRHAADGEFLAAAVEDRPAQGLDAELIAALVAHPLGERIPLHNLQIGIAEYQDNENADHYERDVANAPL